MDIFDLIPLLVAFGLFKKAIEFFKDFASGEKKEFFGAEKDRDYSYDQQQGLYENKMAKDKPDSHKKEQGLKEREYNKDLQFEENDHSNERTNKEINDYNQDIEKTQADDLNEITVNSDDTSDIYQNYHESQEYKEEESEKESEVNIDNLFDPDNLANDMLRGVVFKEILDKPRAKKHYRPPTKR